MVDTAGEVSTTSLFLSPRFDYPLSVAYLLTWSLPLFLLSTLYDVANESGKMFLKSNVVITSLWNNYSKYNQFIITR